MATLKIHHESITAEAAEKLVSLCPFGAISYNGKLEIGAGCKMCGICAKKSGGLIEKIEEDEPICDKSAWRGIAVFAERGAVSGKVHPVAFELLGKARILADKIGHPVYAFIIGHDLTDAAMELLSYGADKVFVCDSPALADFKIDAYTNAFAAFIEQVKPSSVMVGATNLGRSLAPRAAARFGTGLTADCTSLEIKENTDLVQIRPAFGGNIMAQIITPNHRPQFCTVRYKIFDAPEKKSVVDPANILPVKLTEEMTNSAITVVETREKPTEIDISEAERIVAVGRGVKTKEELAMAQAFADKIGARLAGTRPMIEAGWLDPKRQIGLSGRTVKPRVIITLGVSGSVQFAAGMKNSDRIIAVNTDPGASIFNIAHVGIVGDWKDVIAKVMEG
ncbi:MAG: electron transfer flavoprotein subunit alpha/FixB family protein [Ruminococcaceae bacterium]|nr:electron transfer flavoprotein subunit alpha/FixB family protein [Oscillospiraceae bacterium]